MPRRVIAGYFLLQAFTGVAFWLAMAGSETFRSWIELVPGDEAVTDAFLTADLFVGVAGSLLAAWAIDRRRRIALPAAAFTLGGIWYPTLYLMSYVASTGRAGTALAIMIAPSVLTAWFTYHVAVNARQDQA